MWMWMWIDGWMDGWMDGWNIYARGSRQVVQEYSIDIQFIIQLGRADA